MSDDMSVGPISPAATATPTATAPAAPAPSPTVPPVAPGDSVHLSNERQTDQTSRISPLLSNIRGMGDSQSLRRGSRGSDVRQLQQMLNQQSGSGSKLAVDGKYGPKTAAAVRALQASRGLKTDGIAGPQTQHSLHAWQPDTSQSPSLRPAQATPDARQPRVDAPAPTQPGALHSSPTGNRLAQAARNELSDPSIRHDGHHCFSGVKRALQQIGVQTTGVPASGAAPQLAQNPNMREAHVDNLQALPPGAVVVWGSNARHPYGHISVSLGGGREASDVPRNQITHLGSSYRVFVPQDMVSTGGHF